MPRPKSICIIENGRFSWMLRVDGKDISFRGRENAEYFESHYRKLGYQIKHVDTHNDPPN